MALSQPLETAAMSPRTVAPTTWLKMAVFLVIGYLSMSRAFAYLGLPWIQLYIGEIVLAAFLFFGPSAKQGRWTRIVTRARRLKITVRITLLLLCYGFFEAARGISMGYPAFAALRDTAFNYYPLFIFLGIWVGLQDRNLLERVARLLAWWNGCYGLAYVIFLNKLPWTMPGTGTAASEVPIFTEPYGSAIALFGLVAFEPKLRRVWHLLALNALVMLWVQVRAEWLGFFVGLLVFMLCTRRLKQAAVAAATVAVLLLLMYVANIDISSPEGRNGRISVTNLVGRAVAPINQSAASELAPSDAAGFNGTAEWRLVWWAAILETVHSSVKNALLGLGYGYPIGELNPFIEPGVFIQTPHSGFFYALGYGGWLEVFLFVTLQLEIGRLLWRSYRCTGQPFGLMCWTGLLATAMFEDFFETPFGAIPFFLLVGMAIAPGLLISRREHALSQRVFSHPPMPANA